MACPYIYQERHALKQEQTQLLKVESLDIDPPNSHCNIGGAKPSEADPACIMCERSLPDYRFEADYASTVLPKIQAEDFKNFHVQGVSEPFFHGLIFDYMEKINFKNNDRSHVSTITNGIVFDSKKQERWIRSFNHSHVGFSIDASTAETYKKIRRLDTFQMVIRNIENYSRLIADKPQHSMRILHNINTLNINEVVEMVEFAKKVNAGDIEFNLTGRHPPEILINPTNEYLFIEAENLIRKKALEISQCVINLRPFRV